MTLDALRSHFPHTEHSVYLNHAATGPLSEPVVAAMQAYLDQRHRTQVENYFDVQPTIAATRERIAGCLGTTVDRVEFAPNTSSALNVLAEGLDWQPGDRIAVPGCEFPANVYPFLHQERKGVEIDFIPHEEGTFTLDALEDTLTPKTRLLTVSWVQFLSGFRADLEAIGRLCRDRGVLFCVDAIQGLGALQLDVERLGIDFLACGGHKWLMSPQGTGFLYVTAALQEHLTPQAGWLHGPVDWDNFFEYELTFHEDATRFRLGMLNHLGLVGMHAALGLYAEADPAVCEARVLERAAALAEGLDRLGLPRYGTADPDHASGIVTVRHPEPEALYEYLKERDITIAMRNRLLRFAPTYYNHPDEIDRALDAVRAFGRTTVGAGG
ncbi:MAG: aminotransferase class V-fold PLP-dependent enzyme [Bacteroidetes bacterium]|jgi:selenocysteine lyase/cysteine desulfurase|nr:aminotransferase class V-fold PLP-dependent enzyme [Bacteroidota bacterium]